MCSIHSFIHSFIHSYNSILNKEKKFTRLIILLLLSLLFNINNAQTVIKERVRITPIDKSLLRLKQDEIKNDTLWVLVGAHHDWSAIIEGPCGVNRSENGNEKTLKYIYIINPPNGNYSVSVTVHLNGTPGYIGPCGACWYTAGYTGFSHTASFSSNVDYYCANGEMNQTSIFGFRLKYNNDFELRKNGVSIVTCGDINSNLVYAKIFETEDCEKKVCFNDPSIRIKFSIQSQTSDLVFWDNENDNSLGRTTTIPIGSYFTGVGIRLLPSYPGGSSETATVQAEISEVIKTIELNIKAYLPHGPTIDLEKNNINLFHGGKISNILYVDYDKCYEPDFPDNTRFNLEITAGNDLGHLYNNETGENVYSLLNQSINENMLDFKFIADGIAPATEENVIIKITSTDSRIEPIYVTYTVKTRSELLITFDPPIIGPWESSLVNLRERKSNGEIVDFPPDQLFKYYIVEGSDYGFLFAPSATYYMNGYQTISPDGLWFYSYIGEEDTTRITIYVEANSDGDISAASVKEKSIYNKDNKLSKMTSLNEEDNKIFGYGEIMIIKNGARLKIGFDKNPITPGDTTLIIIKGTDEAGLPIEFPSEQTFSVELWIGSEYGELFAQNTNEKGEYIENVKKEFFFIANDSIDIDSAKVGIIVSTNVDGIISQKVNNDHFEISSEKKRRVKELFKNKNSKTKDEDAYFTKNKSGVYKTSTDVEITSENQNLMQLNKVSDLDYLEGYGELLIVKKEIAYIKAFFEKDILVPGDTVNVIVKKVDGEGTETDFPPNTFFEVGIKEGCDVGNILSADGQLTQYFKDINGPLRFVVNDSLEVDSTNIVLRVGVPPSEDEIYLPYSSFVQKQLPLNLTSEISLSKVGGIKKVTDQTTEYCILNTFEYSGHAFAVGEVENINIDIELTGEKSIWPDLINYKKPAGYNPITNVKVKVKRGNTNLANQNVELTIKRIEGTGGHNHIDPPLPISKCGEIKYMGNKGNPITSITDQNGEINTDEILSSQFGGIYYIEAKLKSNPSIKDTVQFFVKVPNLVSLPSSNYYNKIGQVPNHHDNHWGTLDLNTNIEIIAGNWSRDFPQELILQINDMSLIFGGLFDCKKLWEMPHETHRIGKNVDIKTELPGYKAGIPVRIPRNISDWRNTTLVNNRDFERMCRNRGGDAFIHAPNSTNEHYHVSF